MDTKYRVGQEVCFYRRLSGNLIVDKDMVEPDDIIVEKSHWYNNDEKVLIKSRPFLATGVVYCILRRDDEILYSVSNADEGDEYKKCDEIWPISSAFEMHDLVKHKNGEIYVVSGKFICGDKNNYEYGFYLKNEMIHEPFLCVDDNKTASKDELEIYRHPWCVDQPHYHEKGYCVIKNEN